VFQKSCDGGNALACRNLGLMLRDGHGVPADVGRADALLHKACEAGAPFACTNAGDLDTSLIEKEGAPRKQRMLDHYSRGCGQGEAAACRQLGARHLEGTGLPRSPRAAAAWLKKACDGDDAIGCRVLGLLHRDGVGVDRDEARGAQLLRRACERKDDEACKLIGRGGGSGSVGSGAATGK
jgi:TPR repeat protein